MKERKTTKVINISHLRGGLRHWILKHPRHVYIGRNFAWYARMNTTPCENAQDEQRLAQAAREAEFWKNPYVMKNNSDKERRRVVEQYKQHLVDKDKLKYVHKLRGATLACWCVPKLCHGTVLKKICKKTVEKKNLREQAAAKHKLNNKKSCHQNRGASTRPLSTPVASVDQNEPA